VTGVFFNGVRPYDGVTGAATVPGGETAWPKAPITDGRDLGVRAIILLLSDKGRGFGVFCRFCARESGCFLTVETERTNEGVLLGVATGVVTLALMLLLPGAVIDSLEAGMPNRLGVAGMGGAGLG
jgi:hypothetical protein